MRPFNKKEIPPFEVTIEKLVFEGKALARNSDGKIIFVIGDCLPNEKVLVEAIKKKKDYIEARVLKRLNNSSDRQIPLCKYFGTCGGCFLQNLTYQKQLNTKQEFCQEVFDKILKLKSPKLNKVIGSEQEFRYRHKILLNFYQNDSGDLELGYYHQGSWFRVIDVEDCFLFDKRLIEILKITKNWANENNLKAFHHSKFSGLLRNITIRHSKFKDEFMIGIAITDEPKDNSVFIDLFDRLKNIINLKSFYKRVVKVKRRTGETENDYLICGSDYIIENVANINFKIRFGDFFQNNVWQANKMVEFVIFTISKFCKNKKPFILDLYCGVGTFTLPIAKYVKGNIFGVEVVQSAIDSANENALLNNIKNIEFFCKDVNRDIKEILEFKKYDIVLVDPPRAGLGTNVVSALLNNKPDIIIYVSCNPATMARDLTGLLVEYEVQEIQPFDLFPQTYHIECVAILKKTYF